LIKFVVGSNPYGYTSNLIEGESTTNANSFEKYCSYVSKTVTSYQWVEMSKCEKKYVDEKISSGIMDENGCKQLPPKDTYGLNYCLAQLEIYKNKNP